MKKLFPSVGAIIFMLLAALQLPSGGEEIKQDSLFGMYRFVRESSTYSLKGNAKIELELTPPDIITVVATMPGEEPLTDVGTFSVLKKRITVIFPGLEKSVKYEPFEFDGETLVLPLLMIGDGEGTSTWKKVGRGAGTYRRELLNGGTREEALAAVAKELRSDPSVQKVEVVPGRSLLVTYKSGYQEFFLAAGAHPRKEKKKENKDMVPLVIPAQHILQIPMFHPRRRAPTKEEKYERWLEFEPEPVSHGDAPKAKGVLILAPFDSTAIQVAGSTESGGTLYYENLKEDLTAISKPLSSIGYDVPDPLKDEDVTVEKLWRLFHESWGVIYFRTHGGIIPGDDYILATGQLIPRENAWTDADREKYINDYLDEHLGEDANKVWPYVMAGFIEGSTPVIGIRSGFFKAAGADFSSSLVFINACESTLSKTLVQEVSARSFVGWRCDSDKQLAGDVAAPFFRCLVRKTRTDREAADFAKNYLLEIKGYDSKITLGSSYNPNNLDVYRLGKSEPEKALDSRQRRMMITVRDWAIRQRHSHEGKEDLEGLTDRLLECKNEDLESVDKQKEFPTFCGEAFAFEVAPRDMILEVKGEVCGYKGGKPRFTLIEK